MKVSVSLICSSPRHSPIATFSSLHVVSVASTYIVLKLIDRTLTASGVCLLRLLDILFVAVRVQIFALMMGADTGHARCCSPVQLKPVSIITQVLELCYYKS